MIKFFVAMEPRGKQRARITKHANYTPKETVDAERIIGWECKKAMAEIGAKPLEGPVHLEIVAWFPYPKSWSIRKRMRHKYHTVKPDRDNIEKLVQDALNKVAWIDDAQVCDGPTKKLYATVLDKVGLAIQIWEL